MLIGLNPPKRDQLSQFLGHLGSEVLALRAILFNVVQLPVVIIE